MSGILFRHFCAGYLRAFLGIFATVLSIFLVVDFVDRAKGYTGAEAWLWAVLQLYGYKAITVTHQLAPAALLLAGGAAASLVRKRGELTALRALAFGPEVLYGPVALCALAICLGLVAFDEYLVGPASRRVDEITFHHFKRQGDWRFHHLPKQWFRSGSRVIHLRAGDAEGGFHDVTLFGIGEGFRLASRVDAQRMVHVEGTRWRLEGARERRFLPNGESPIGQGDREVDLGVDKSAFRIRAGRPEQMRVAELREQIEARKAVGLSASAFELALHSRLAYPLAGLPAALLAVGLALRARRKGHLTTAMVEGLAVAMSMWGLMVVARTLANSQRLSPFAAAWMPALVLSVGAAILYLRGQGRLRLRRSARTSLATGPGAG